MVQCRKVCASGTGGLRGGGVTPTFFPKDFPVWGTFCTLNDIKGLSLFSPGDKGHFLFQMVPNGSKWFQMVAFEPLVKVAIFGPSMISRA